MSRDAYNRRQNDPWQPNERQRQVLDLLVEGKTNAEIAAQLSLSIDGAKWHVGELLAETECDDRQQLARWWQERREKGAPAVATWLALRPSFVVVGLAAVAVLLVVGWLTLRGKGTEPASELVHPGIDEGFLGGGPIRTAEKAFSEFFVELTVEGGQGESRVVLRDVRTGDRLGLLKAGYRPMVAVRESAQELLASSGLRQDGGLGFREVLEVYDLSGYSLQLKTTIEMPNRVNCTTYCDPMALSRDERYLYYAARTTAPECGAGGDASVCDVHSVVRVDLAGAGDAETVELRRGCGVPILAQAGESGAVVACRGQYPVNGGWTAVLEPGSEPRVIDFATSRLQVAHVTAAGDVLVIGEGGGVIKEDLLGVRTTAVSLPGGLGFGPRVFYYGGLDLGDDRLFLIFDNADFGSHDRKYGFVVLDARKMAIEGHGRVPEAIAYLPNGDSVYVLREGRIDVLDLTTGRLTSLAEDVGGGVEVLLPGR